MTLRIYTDTSVIGGCLDREFQVPSSRLVEKFKPGEAVIVLVRNVIRRREALHPKAWSATERFRNGKVRIGR